MLQSGISAGSDDCRDDRYQGRIGHGGPAGGARFAAVDPKHLEDGAVEDLAGFGAAGAVELLGMLQERDHLFETLADLIASGLCLLDEPLGISDLRTNPGLPFLEGIDGQGIGHVGIDELLLLTFQLGETALLVGDEPTARLNRAVQVVARSLAEHSDLLVREADGKPLAPHRFLGLRDG